MKKNLATLFILLTFSVVSLRTYAQTTVTTTTTTTTTTSEVTVETAPPEMPVYEQPACPTDGYMWTPGYWAYGNLGYYWIPGVWVAPPHPGLLWTPCWWGYENGRYGYHEGYWGRDIGYYGGINYGYGYGGEGYYGGRWNGDRFAYNTSLSHVDNNVVHTTYIDNTVIVHNNSTSHASFNGPGGYTRQPSENELRVSKSSDNIKPTAEQQTHQKTISADKSSYFSNNHGHPANIAMDKVGGHPYDEKGTQQPKTNVAPSRQNTPAAPNRPSNITLQQHTAPKAPPRPQPQQNTQQVKQNAGQNEAPQQSNNRNQQGQSNVNVNQPKTSAPVQNNNITQQRQNVNTQQGNNSNQKQNYQSQQNNTQQKKTPSKTTIPQKKVTPKEQPSSSGNQPH